MNKFLRFFILFSIVSIISFTVSYNTALGQSKQNNMKKEYKELKEKYEQALKKDTPKSAIEICDKIIEKATKEGDYGWLYWAYFSRNSSLFDFAPDSLYTELDKLENICSKESNKVNKALLHAILANAYFQYRDYYDSDNETNVESLDDSQLSPLYLQEWTHKQIEERIFKHIDESLSEMSALHKVSTTTYTPLIESVSKKEKHIRDISELFDHDMLHAIYFLNIESLADLSHSGIIEKTKYIDALSSKVAEFYTKNNNFEAVLYLKFYQITHFSPNEDKYTELEKLYNQSTIESDLKGDILYNMALSAPDNVKSLELCNLYLKLYPKGKVLSEVERHKKNILKPEIGLRVPIVVSTKEMMELIISYKNITSVTIQRGKVTNPYHLNKVRKVWNNVIDNTKEYDYFKDLNWESIEIELPPCKDYSTETIGKEIPAPKELGTYIYRISPETLVKGRKNVSVQNVSELALIICKGSQSRNDIIVVDRNTGNPIQGADIEIFTKKGNKESVGIYKSNKDGLVSLSNLKKGIDYIIEVKKGEDQAYPGMQFYSYQSYSTTNKTDVILNVFCDRGLYRPGQSVHFKGIAYSQTKDSTLAIKNMGVLLTLFDANHNEVSSMELKTNQFGSFSGTFSLPNNLLNGHFSIKCQALDNKVREYNSCYFEVAEYKRPKFSVEIENYDKPYRLGDTIELRGKALTLTGVPISEADVKATISSMYSFYWRRSQSFEQVYQTKTDSNGNFTIRAQINTFDKELSNGFLDISIDITAQDGETQGTTTSLSLSKSRYILSWKETKFCKDYPIEESFLLTNSNRNEVKERILFTLKDTKGEIVDQGEVESNIKSAFAKWNTLKSGRYSLSASIKGVDTSEISLQQEIILYSFNDDKPVENTPLWFEKKGDTLYYGTSYKDATMFMDIVGNNKVISFEAIPVSNEIRTLDIGYKESYNDGISVQLFIFREGTLYAEEIEIIKPEPDKHLNIRWKTFRDKLQSGQEEKWTLTITDKDEKVVDSEVLALMYDSSLDQIAKNNFSPDRFKLSFTRRIDVRSLVGENYPLNKRRSYISYTEEIPYTEELEYKKDYFSILFFQPQRYIMRSKGMFGSVLTSVQESNNSSSSTTFLANPRSNFNENAFFYPHLRTDANGDVSIEFTLPESLTKWNFIALAHNEKIDYGTIKEEIVAQKDFMLSPNMPRFLRRSDKTNISSTITNLTQKEISANVVITLFDPITERVYYEKNKEIVIGAGANQVVDFIIDEYPQSADIVGVKIMAYSREFADGEQHLLSILPNTTRVVESVSIPIRGKSQRTFSLSKLFNNHSNTATNKTLTIELTGNPAWQAVTALPAISQPTSDNAISWITALYANSISSAILKANPKIERTIESWKAIAQNNKENNYLQSSLEKNDELKNIVLNETPWVLEAKDQREQMERLSNLFNTNNTSFNIAHAAEKIEELQQNNGGWCWFKGMNSSRFVTDYVLTLLARIKLYAQADDLWKKYSLSERQNKGIKYLSQCAKKEYDDIQKYLSENKNAKIEGISYMALRYLYVLTLTYPDLNFKQILDIVGNNYKKPINYFLEKVYQNPTMWDMEEKGMVARVLYKNNKKAEAQEVIRSIKEHLTKDESNGMFFDFIEYPWVWNKMRINAQTTAIEAISQIDNDPATIEEMKIWLLSQKQTQDWGGTPSSADAIYSLLMIGDNPLDNQGVVKADIIEKSGRKIVPIPAVNYIKELFTDQETLNTNSITLTKEDDGWAWGAVYATFNEVNTNVKEVSSEQMGINKELYVKRKIERKGGYQDELQLITKDNPVRVGDIVTARMIIKIGKDMDFVQLKEQRAACFEPINQLSGYRFDGGIWFYLENKDSSTNLFFEHLSKGVYVLELNYRVSRVGEYDAGFASLQCSYAPQFSAHTSSIKLSVE